MNNVKVILTKQTMTNNFTEAVTQKHLDGKMPQKYAALPEKNTDAHVQIQNPLHTLQHPP